MNEFSKIIRSPDSQRQATHNEFLASAHQCRKNFLGVLSATPKSKTPPEAFSAVMQAYYDCLNSANWVRKDSSSTKN